MMIGIQIWGFRSESQNFSFTNHNHAEYISGSSINYLNKQIASAENDNHKVLTLPEKLFINLSEKTKRILQEMQIDLTLHKLILTK